MSLSEDLLHNGYALFAPNELMSIHSLLAACQKPAEPIRRQKSFIGSLAVSPALVNETHKLSVERELVGYLGPAPIIKSIELYRSTSNTERYKSGQLWHMDIDFALQVKMFFMCRPTTHDNGPFTFISAQDSATVQKATGYIPGKSLDDAYLQSYSPIELIGDAGSLVFIDTSRCLHFGSRCKAGERIALVVQFTQGTSHYKD